MYQSLTILYKNIKVLIWCIFESMTLRTGPEYEIMDVGVNEMTRLCEKMER